ncbi:alpha/beta hydrolase [Emcibacter sp. SYSU 3D8]|uniref:alpha/beta fold hydrolase n=1 Tax=Emcibacter sp. SYSU 3D8 TaxID=3133969 RepID=UPI0031FE69AB
MDAARLPEFAHQRAGARGRNGGAARTDDGAGDVDGIARRAVRVEAGQDLENAGRYPGIRVIVKVEGGPRCWLDGGMEPSISTISVNGHDLAYEAVPGRAPGVIFLPGFKSDMTGTKAEALRGRCIERGQAFTRFDYSGHGRSTGKFEDGTIGRWAADAVAIIDQVAVGPQILVGSSMGGWMALLAARARPERIAGLVGIAAAPDFTEDLMWASYPESVKDALRRDGVWHEPSDYGEPYTITLRLIEEGRQHLVLRSPLALPFPVRLIQGMKDPDVPWRTALRLAEHIDGDDVEVILVKGGDHRLSEPADIARLGTVLERLST